MRRILVSAIALALAGASDGAAGGHGGAAAQLATTQLPRTVVPTHYDVAVVPHADKMTFDGQVTVSIEVPKPTSSITLNAPDMTFSKASLTSLKNKMVMPTPR